MRTINDWRIAKAGAVLVCLAVAASVRAEPVSAHPTALSDWSVTWQQAVLIIGAIFGVGGWAADDRRRKVEIDSHLKNDAIWKADIDKRVRHVERVVARMGGEDNL